MEINLQRMATFESENPTAQYTLALMNSAICAYFNTAEVDIADLEPLFPIYRSLETLEIVTDIPELEDVPQHEEDDAEDDEDEG